MQRIWTALVLVAFGIGISVFAVSPSSPARAQGAPTVRVTGPANGSAASNPVTVTVETAGAIIKPATANDPNAAHLHYFIDRDPASVLQPGQPIPSGQADIIHTDATSQPIPNLSSGQHTIWVVLAHTDHTPFSPNVQAQVSFSVGAAGQAPAPASGRLPTAGDDASRLLVPMLIVALALVVGGSVALKRMLIRP